MAARPSLLALVLAALPSGLTAQDPATSALARSNTGFDGVWTLLVENDNFAFGKDDGNYTNGFVLGYASSAVEGRAPQSLSNRVVGWSSFLPFMDDETYRHHAAFAFGQLVFTPEKLTAPNPAKDARPYAGVLFFDTSVYARGARSLHAYTLRLGVTGPISGAEWVQENAHNWVNTTEPQGWSHQIHDEPLLNLGYEYHRRLAPGARAGSIDLTPNLGGTIGNYMIAANAGAMLRLGWNLPDGYGPPFPRRGFENHALYGAAPGRQGWYFLFGGVDGYWVGRDVTLDGNTWKDSRSTDKEIFVGQAYAGLEVAWGRLVLRAAFTIASNAFETQGDQQQIGSFSISWFH